MTGAVPWLRVERSGGASSATVTPTPLRLLPNSVQPFLGDHDCPCVLFDRLVARSEEGGWQGKTERFRYLRSDSDLGLGQWHSPQGGLVTGLMPHAVALDSAARLQRPFRTREGPVIPFR